MSPGQAARRRLGSSAGLAPFPHRFHSTKQRCRVSRGKAACRAVIPRFPDTSAVDQGPAARSYPLQPVPPPGRAGPREAPPPQQRPQPAAGGAAQAQASPTHARCATCAALRARAPAGGGRKPPRTRKRVRAGCVQ